MCVFDGYPAQAPIQSFGLFHRASLALHSLNTGHNLQDLYHQPASFVLQGSPEQIALPPKLLSASLANFNFLIPCLFLPTMHWLPRGVFCSKVRSSQVGAHKNTHYLPGQSTLKLDHSITRSLGNQIL
eukprot:1161230-Pelagomonas_calceolata.AAC.10